MKIQQLQQQNSNESKNPSYKGAGDIVLRYLVTNQAVGANAIDLTSMVIPRTASDAIRRGSDAGWETGRRESMGVINDSLIGVYGATAGMIVALLMGIKNEYDIPKDLNINKIFAAPETLNILSDFKARQVKAKTADIDYIREVLTNIRAYNPDLHGEGTDGLVKLSKETIDDIAPRLEKAIKSGISYDKWIKKDTPDSMAVIINKITAETGIQNKYVLKDAGQKLVSEAKLETLFEDIFKISQTFNQKKVKEAFEEQVKNGKGLQDNKYVKTMNKFLKRKSIAGFLTAATVGLLVQPINVYITKLKTGQDGFIGVEGRKKDDSYGIKALKIGTSLGFMAYVLKTLDCKLSRIETLPKDFLDKMAFKGFWPTVNLLKGIYGITIISRLMATRDSDELRESLTKDFLGFTSWLILGDIVNKITAGKLDKSVVNYKKGTENKNWFVKAYRATLKTRDEVLIKTLADNKIALTKEINGETVAKTFKEMLKDVEKLAPELQKKVKKQLSTLNKAQIAGYLFSGLLLGLGIPNLNIYITNILDKKKKAKAAASNTKVNA